MRFGWPPGLWILLAVPVLALLLGLEFHRRRRTLQRLGDLPLLRRLTRSVSIEKRIIKSVLLVIASVFLVLALARPQWGVKTEEITRRGIDVMLVVDVSRSMLAEDIKPNRLMQARGAILQLLEMMHGDRVGLVAFAGTAYVACPLTLDYSAAAMFVDVLDVDLLPIQGTAIAEALRTAVKAFPEKDGRHQVILLITDGEDHEGDIQGAVQEASDRGIIIEAIGVGDPTGVPIPMRNARGEVTGYKEDDDHRKVTSRLDEGALASIAVATHGKYYRSTSEGIELKRIYEEIAAMDQKTLSSRLVTRYEDRYAYPLGAALILLAIEAALGDRRRPTAAGREAAPGASKEAA
jgi:Ca-activated chloride channel family protein